MRIFFRSSSIYKINWGRLPFTKWTEVIFRIGSLYISVRLLGQHLAKKLLWAWHCSAWHCSAWNLSPNAEFVIKPNQLVETPLWIYLLFPIFNNLHFSNLPWRSSSIFSIVFSLTSADLQMLVSKFWSFSIWIFLCEKMSFHGTFWTFSQRWVFRFW